MKGMIFALTEFSVLVRETRRISGQWATHCYGEGTGPMRAYGTGTQPHAGHTQALLTHQDLRDKGGFPS